MTSITIRDVPEEVRDVLASRVARAGQSLQEHLRLTLIEVAARPSPREWVVEVRRRKGQTGAVFDADQILAHRDAERR